MIIKKDIRTIEKNELESFFLAQNSPKFRATQVIEWIWKHHQLDFNKMSNLSISERELLKQKYIVKSLYISDTTISIDGTVKFLFKMDNNNVVEGVLIPQLNRLTVCISSQAGCSLACNFCATGKLKLDRNLTAGEIYDQVFLINQYALNKYNKSITNIVYMGMGEPLLNFKNVLMSIDFITSSNGMGMSGKRITVSTVGITKMIKKIADLKPNFNLAISLHSANDKKRSEIMAINETNTLSNLELALKYFYDTTKIKPTYEYILLKDFNDSIEDAQDLIKFCKKIPSKVNIIEYNKVEGLKYQKSTMKKTNIFLEVLEKNNILVKLRRSRGEDIGAACGQLATQNK